MGLAIAVYTNLGEKFESDSEDEDRLHLDNHPDFANVGDGLDGYYKYPEASLFRFRVGSYSEYTGVWRETLCKKFLNPELPPNPPWESNTMYVFDEVGQPSLTAYARHSQAAYKDPDQYKNRPFFELVNFSDCEGYIGPVTSAKLWYDFESHLARAYQITEGSGFFETYIDFMNAFKLAAQNNGIVLFC